MATAIPFGDVPQVYDNGSPLSGGKIYFYAPGTSTLRTPYSDTALSVPTTNPVLLNSAGWPATNVYLDSSQAYDYIIKSADDAETLWPRTTIPSNASASQPVDATLTGIAALVGTDGDSVEWTGTDTFRTVKRTVATYSALKAITGQQSGDEVAVLGRTTAGDGGNGHFRWATGDQSTNVTNDASSGIYVPPDSDTDGSSGCWVRQTDGSRRFNGLWFGAVGDGATDNATVMNNMVAFIDAFSVDGGELYFPAGTYQIASEVTLDVIGFRLTGDGLISDGDIATSALTIFEGTGTTAPVFRIKVDRFHLNGFMVSSDATRYAATKVTASNYSGLSLTRNDQNFGIWIEPDDSASSDEVGNFHVEDVWIEKQPNSNWVICGKTYVSVIERSGSRYSGEHGWVFDKGTYTGRTNVESTGIIDVYGCEAYQNDGHGLCCGHPDDDSGPSTIRMTIINFDSYTNGQDAAVLHETYDTYFIADNSRIEYSAFNGNNTRGGVYTAGLGIELLNNRYLDISSSLEPVMVDGTHCTGTPRTTYGVRVWGGYVTSSGTCTNFVSTQNSPNNVDVEVDVLTGAFTNAAPTSVMVRRKQGALLWNVNLTQTGTQTLTGNTTRTGTLTQTSDMTVSGGVLNVTRDSNVVAVINRTTNDGDLIFLRQDGTTEGTISVSGTTVTYGSFNGSHWSQFEDQSYPDLLPGTILSSVDALCSWKWDTWMECVEEAVVNVFTDGTQEEASPARYEDRSVWYTGDLLDGDTYTDEQGRVHTIAEDGNDRLPMVEVSQSAGDTAVYGVFQGLSNSDGEPDMFVGALGAGNIRIAAGETVQRGDLIESNGDGCGKVQADDVFRASTVAKVTSAEVIETYPDGSYLVPCTLHCG
ncbi:hypothetical protein [Hyphomonas sp. CY54-11-8]|uniref:glycosyl hydrolase family 28-related protein n=1 Tax=Hyphomonas sp. CY54-11-8 TaxID=1280944 RepID=UPI0004591A2E|nr:hypothetical protein [Hyphomonas sp. CY54-11-8]KCZ47782.1 hypothetical protein HY17_04715 [Hyphomonas sp. CY54-11-8]